MEYQEPGCRTGIVADAAGHAFAETAGESPFGAEDGQTASGGFRRGTFPGGRSVGSGGARPRRSRKRCRTMPATGRGACRNADSGRADQR